MNKDKTFEKQKRLDWSALLKPFLILIGNKMNEEYRKILADYFTASELVDFLDIDVREIIDLFEDKIMDNKEDVDEIIGY